MNKNGEFVVLPNPTTGLVTADCCTEEFSDLFDVLVGLDWVFGGSESFGSFEVAVTSVEIDVEAGSGPIFCFDPVDDSCHTVTSVVLDGNFSSFEHGHYEDHD